MLKFGNKEFNNLQEQVLVNANAIEEIKQGLGTALPNPIAGPQGPQGVQGEQGVQGIRGSAWTVGTDLPASANLGDIHLLWNGDVYQYTTNGWELKLNIRGSQGVEGRRGFTGPQGATGPQGLKGEQGLAGPIYRVVGQLESIEELPDPATIASNEAYIVNNDIYGIVANEWVNFGPTLVTTTAESVSSIPVNLVQANNVQGAINELSWADNIEMTPYNNTYSNNVGDHIREIADGFVNLEHKVDTLETATLKTLVLDGDSLQSAGYVNLGYTPEQLSEYDVLKVTFSTDKQLSPELSLHPGTYFFRKMGYRTLSNTVDHIIFELSYNAATHNLNLRDISVFIEAYRTSGAIIGFRISPNDTQVVHLTGDESISGRKTFSDFKIQSNAYDNIASIYTTENSIVIKADDDSSHHLIYKPLPGELSVNNIKSTILVPQLPNQGVLGSSTNKWSNIYIKYISDGSNQITVQDVVTLKTDVGNIGTILDQVNGEVL